MKKTHKENNTKVIIPKEIITYLMDLADTLFEKDYYSYIEYANILIDDILDFIHTLPHAPHYNLSHTAEMRFNRYGKDLQYAFFKRKSSKHTTWYVFFNRKGDRYIIRYISKKSAWETRRYTSSHCAWFLFILCLLPSMRIGSFRCRLYWLCRSFCSLRLSPF